MGIPALKLESEEPVVEERVAVLEANIEHIQSDVSEIDVRRLSAKADAVNQKVDDFKIRVEKQFGELGVRMEKGFAALGDRIPNRKIGRAYERVWRLPITAALLGVMAKVFNWF